MKQIILGTAGHVDHGKTSLVKALTGVETDRLKEEKERGITIELGFASLSLGKDINIGIVDMPGHEKFVKNMVAGSSGIDLVVMTIAADEGVMPQTREHMEICSLLGIKHGLIALTKIDIVDDDLMELALEDISDFVEGTFLEEAPVVPLSSVTGEGLDDFLVTLEKVCRQVPERSFSSIFRLPVDRVFSMKGFGTVITGTLVSGKANVGENIVVYPSMIESKVRGIQVHGESVDTVESGTRTAVNFQGLDKESVNRGDVLSSPDTLILSYMIDTEFMYIKSNPKPVKARTKIRFHAGTSEILGTLVLLDREELQPGEKACVQVRLDSPVCCLKNDKYVIRSYSPVRTIGGGRILNPVAQKHKLFDKDIIRGLNDLLEDDLEKDISFFVEQASFSGTSFKDLRVMTNARDKKLESAIQKMLAKKEIVQTNKERQVYVHGSVFEKFSTTLMDKLKSYHQANALKEGMPTEELKSKFEYYNKTKLFNIVLNNLLKDKKIIQNQNIIKLSDHEVALEVDQHAVKDKIFNIYKKAGLTPPFFRTICQDLKLDKKVGMDVLHMLINNKDVIKTKDDLYFDNGSIDKLKKELVDFLEKSGEITTPQFKEMTGISRKFVIPLIEYFDSINLTIRVGDTRQLRKKAG
ncbi:MAG: selenocysteine-specific translation elongation factor [Desulfobacteraceae bacterium]|nr:selenocysteine-specific translation elongation factor [Desulfobacteraceae bacterium]